MRSLVKYRVVMNREQNETIRCSGVMRISEDCVRRVGMHTKMKIVSAEKKKKKDNDDIFRILQRK